MPELIKLNGAAVTAASLFRREVTQPDGSSLDEYQVAVMIRGRMTHRSFASLLEAETIRLELGTGASLETTVTASTVASTGGGESAVYRHDFTLRETPASAARRAAEQEAAAEQARLAAAVAELDVMVPDDTRVSGKAKRAGEDDLSLRVSTPVDVWADALRKMQNTPEDGNGSTPRPPAAPPVPAAPPAARTPSVPPSPPAAEPAPAKAAPAGAEGELSLTPAEVAGIEAVLVGLRLETIIDALDRLQILPRDEIEQAFRRLVQQRFVAEATLVVGEPVARRAARDILQGLGLGRWALRGD